MKKFILFCSLLVLGTLSAHAFFTSDEFYQKLKVCNPTNNTSHNIIHGVANGRCHFSMKGQEVTDQDTNRSVKLDNCYIPMSEMNNYVSLSLKVNAFMTDLLKTGNTPPESELTYYKNLMRQKFNYEYKYCR